MRQRLSGAWRRLDHPVIAGVVTALVVASVTAAVQLVREGAELVIGDEQRRVSVTVLGGPDDSDFRVGVINNPPAAYDWELVRGDGGPLAWARAHGGAEVGLARRRLVLQGRRGTSVVTDLRARVVERHPPVAAVVENKALPRFGTVAVAKVDLDTAEPGAVVMATDDHPLASQDGKPFFDAQTLTLQEDETQTIDLWLTADECDCSFELDLTIVTDGQTETYTVSDVGGRPFRLVTGRGAPAWSVKPCPSSGASALVPATPTPGLECIPLPPP